VPIASTTRFGTQVAHTHRARAPPPRPHRTHRKCERVWDDGARVCTKIETTLAAVVLFTRPLHISRAFYYRNSMYTNTRNVTYAVRRAHCAHDVLFVFIYYFIFFHSNSPLVIQLGYRRRRRPPVVCARRLGANVQETAAVAGGGWRVGGRRAIAWGQLAETKEIITWRSISSSSSRRRIK